jgi:NAD+ synthase (glutamine-hydrolysing)
VGAVEENVASALRSIEEARREGCDLVVFPELALSGYFPFDLVWRPGFVARVERGVRNIAKASRGIGVIVGGISARPRKGAVNRTDPSSVADGAAEELSNSAFFLADGKLLLEQAKLHLPSFDVYGEERYFTPGAGTQVFDFRGRRLGVTICEDLWVDDGPVETQASLGAEIVINISASPFFAGKGAIRRRLGARRAEENGVFLLYVNRVGGQDELVFDGGSFLVDREGDLLFQAPYFDEGLFVLDLDRLAPLEAPREDPIDLVRRAIILGIRDYVTKNGFSHVLVGLSGGIDSALVAALAVEALGPKAVTGVSLPSAITAPENQEDAREVARRLGIALVEVPIEGVVDACRRALPRRPSGVTDENLQARARGTLLMALANERSALVLVTGNKSEIAVGYNTLYGDTAGALAPIADLYKTEVYKLGRSLGERIPARVREKPPTAELRPGQRDEDDLPPYSLLDPLLSELVERNASRADLVARGFDEEVVGETLARYYRSEYKRRQFPPGIKVSPKAFGIGRRIPLTHSWRD